MAITKLVTDHQPGVGLAVSHFAEDEDIVHGGWVPPGSPASKAAVALGEAQYLHGEDTTPASLKNVYEADATLLVVPRGSDDTLLRDLLIECKAAGKPYFVYNGIRSTAALKWIKELEEAKGELTLHLAGDRYHPQAERATTLLLRYLLKN